METQLKLTANQQKRNKTTNKELHDKVLQDTGEREDKWGV
jgi:hypothetical protein